MITVIRNAWALLLGMFLLQLGNGMQGTVLGLRGGIEAFDNFAMGLVMSGYFLGFLGGAKIAPILIRRVGHVRVFAALAALASAALILYATLVHPVAWIVMRVLVGFCFSGVYVVVESWLNEGSDNTNRGQALSAYLVAQMIGIVVAQAMVNVADPAGYDLFVLMAVAVSVAVVPTLLSASPAPVFETGRPMSMARLYETSPTGFIGCLLLGGMFGLMFGMASVYGSTLGLTPAQISLFIGTIYFGGVLFQIPVGWLSDRLDRRVLIVAITAVGALGGVIGLAAGASLAWLLLSALLLGGAANPLYAVLVAYTNDYLEHEDMASAAAGLVVLNGIGAVGTPIVVGLLMDIAGPGAFMGAATALMGATTLYALYRMTVRAATPVDEALPIAPMAMTTSPVAGSAAQEAVIEQVVAEEEETAAEAPIPAGFGAAGLAGTASPARTGDL
ncbi:MAG: MFS transporter [Pseudomonadota bacterium]